ncbi:MAG: LysE family transporter [Rhodospirillales bacterium]|nr:LysE family transporter [Alphaproteobacteria bacterium]MCB9987692.1 LysE family transporter [Rhodospirillales bacterium]USO08555.1 MAG: LysE family transporter [Rhodospirillales bacterium]
MPALTVFVMSLIAMISPGPDFLCVLKNSLGHGFRAGAATALGIASALWVHIAYCMVGLAVVIAQSILMFNVIKWLGAAYLLYLAWHALRSKGWDDHMVRADRDPALSPRRAFMQGFVTNALNPKATLFFLALFTQVIDPHTPIAVQLSYGAMISGMGAVWFVAVAAVMTRPAIRTRFARISKWIDRACGAAFVALAAKLALARQ